MSIRYWSSDVCSSDLHRPFHPHARIENAADEDADQIGPETQPDIVNGDFVIGVSQVIEQQAKAQVRQGVADLVKQDEEQHQKCPPTPEECEKRSGDGLHDLGSAAFLADLGSEEQTSEIKSLMRISYAVLC